MTPLSLIIGGKQLSIEHRNDRLHLPPGQTAIQSTSPELTAKRTNGPNVLQGQAAFKLQRRIGKLIILSSLNGFSHVWQSAVVIWKITANKVLQ